MPTTTDESSPVETSHNKLLRSRSAIVSLQTPKGHFSPSSWTSSYSTTFTFDAHSNLALGWMKILSHPPFAIEFPMPGFLSHLTSPTHQQDAEGANDIYRILNTCKEWNDRKYLQHRVASRNSNECKCSLRFYGAKTHLIRRFISEASDENLLNVRCAFQL